MPVELIDVAGLVPDAHAGKGLGNKFLDDVRQASTLIHIVDATGATDIEGNPCNAGAHDPTEDVAFLEQEIWHWIKDILLRGWRRAMKQSETEGKKISSALHERLTGLGISETQITLALRNTDLKLDRPSDWSEEDVFILAREIQRAAKPMIIAANKADLASNEQIDALKALDGYTVVPVSAEIELALRRAEKSGLIEYTPGAASFEIVNLDGLNTQQKKGLEHHT